MANELVEFLKKVKESKSQDIVTTPKKVLNMFGSKRRGVRVTGKIKALLKSYDLMSTPDFSTAFCYGKMTIKARPKVGIAEEANIDDLVPKLGIMAAANIGISTLEKHKHGLLSVKKNTPFMEAVTSMIKHDISQIPVLSGRNAIGIIDWKSIGIAMVLGKNCKTVSDCMKPVEVLSVNTSLFEAVEKILKKGTILVKQQDNTITGLVTPKNITEQFIDMSRPFLLLEQIENHIRKLLANKLELEDLKKVLDEEKLTKDFTDLTSLSFGNYVRIIENEDNYAKLKIRLKKSVLVNMLKKTNKLRNDVMHFNPEEMDAGDLEHLEETLRVLKVLVDACS
jgi:predicted transcriptional regulator